ncbi:hypothetical protein, partial [Frankia sp. Cr1]|uniref:hypothetical protein n=1 Tax=Frankia sp. Cr1 TaxID=3073931 RepID=UPI002AD41F0F
RLTARCRGTPWQVVSARGRAPLRCPFVKIRNGNLRGRASEKDQPNWRLADRLPCGNLLELAVGMSGEVDRFDKKIIVSLVVPL